MTVDPKKLMKEWVRKKTATPMEPKTTAIHPAFNRGLLFACSSSLARNFQPWRLVAWQNRWKQPEDVDMVGTSLHLLPIMTYHHFHIWQNFGWAKRALKWNIEVFIKLDNFPYYILNTKIKIMAPLLSFALRIYWETTYYVCLKKGYKCKYTQRHPSNTLPSK